MSVHFLRNLMTLWAAIAGLLIAVLPAPALAQAAPCGVLLMSPADGATLSANPAFLLRSNCPQLRIQVSPSGTFVGDTASTAWASGPAHRFPDPAWDVLSVSTWSSGVYYRAQGRSVAGIVTSDVRYLDIDTSTYTCTETTYGGISHLFCEDRVDWQTASDACTDLGGALATVADSAHNDFIATTADGLGWDTGAWEMAWLGGTDAASEGTWTWISGFVWSYENWNAGEPNESGSGEDHLALNNASQGYTWNDYHGSATLPFVCML